MARTKQTSRKTYKGGSDNGGSDPAAPSELPPREDKPTSAAATAVPPKPAKRTSLPRQAKKAAKSRASKKTLRARTTKAKVATKNKKPTEPVSQKARKNKALDRIMQSVGMSPTVAHAGTSSPEWFPSPPAYEAAPTRFPRNLSVDPFAGTFTKQDNIMLQHLQRKFDAHNKRLLSPGDPMPQIRTNSFQENCRV